MSEEVDKDEVQQLLIQKWNGLHENRFLYSCAIDFAIAAGDKDKANQLIDKVMVFDKMRVKYW